MGFRVVGSGGRWFNNVGRLYLDLKCHRFLDQLSYASYWYPTTKDIGSIYVDFGAINPLVMCLVMDKSFVLFYEK